MSVALWRLDLHLDSTSWDMILRLVSLTEQHCALQCDQSKAAKQKLHTCLQEAVLDEILDTVTPADEVSMTLQCD